jgi:hypothetical protein
MKQDSKYSTFGIIGLVGLGIHVAVNLVALLAFKKSTAEFFSEPWWSTWFPGYTVWLIFLGLGLAARCGGKNGADKQ